MAGWGNGIANLHGSSTHDTRCASGSGGMNATSVMGWVIMNVSLAPSLTSPMALCILAASRALPTDALMDERVLQLLLRHVTTKAFTCALVPSPLHLRVLYEQPAYCSQCMELNALKILMTTDLRNHLFTWVLCKSNLCMISRTEPYASYLDLLMLGHSGTAEPRRTA